VRICGAACGFGSDVITRTSLVGPAGEEYLRSDS
jgi:hypothetical protein